MISFASARRAGSRPAGIARSQDPFEPRMRARATRAWPVLALFALLQFGCATRPATPEPRSAPVPNAPAPLEEPARIAVPAAQPSCPACAELRAENARLRIALDERDAQLHELRVRQHTQEVALEQQTRQAAARLSRVATRADAASYIAEVEVAMATTRSTAGLADDDARLTLAQGYLASSRRPFERGKYGTAIGLASRAAALIANASGVPAQSASLRRASAIAAFEAAVPMRVTLDSHLRQRPSAGATVRGVLRAGSTLVAVARSGRWMRVEVADGRSGWVYGPLLGAP